MASTSGLSADHSERFKLCSFCNASTAGHEKRLFAEPQPKGPYFPILAEIRGECHDLDELGRAVVCLACFHHLLRQWSRYERRGIPQQKRVYNLIADDSVNNFQHRREDEIRREAEQTLKSIQHREQKIRQEAEEKLKLYQEREREIRQEAERKLCEEQRQVDEVRKQTERKLKEEQLKEERVKRQLDLRIIEEKEKGDYIRKEAERLLREEKLIGDRSTAQHLPEQPIVIKRYRTEVIVPELRGNLGDNNNLAKSAPDLRSGNVGSSSESDDSSLDMDSSQPEVSLRSERKKKMVYDPETGCYIRVSADTQGVVGDGGKQSANLNGSSSKKEAPLRVSTTSTKTSDSTKNLGASPSRRESLERRRKVSDTKKAQVHISGGASSKAPSGTAKASVTPSKTSTVTSKDRPKSEPNLDTKLKEMEQRRARMFLHGKDEGGAENKTEDKSGDGSSSPEGAPRNKKRTREERNRRRLSAEKINRRRSAGEDILSPRHQEPKKDDGGEQEKEVVSSPTVKASSVRDSPAKADKPAVKIEYVWDGKKVTKVEIPVGKSKKEVEEELGKVGQPIKGYIKKDSEEGSAPEEEPMDPKVTEGERRAVEPEPKTTELLINLESTTEGEKMDDSAQDLTDLHGESDSAKAGKTTEDAGANLFGSHEPRADSVDGPEAKSLDDFVAETLGEFRKRADSTEGETFPTSDKFVQIEKPIEMNRTVEVHAEPTAESSPRHVFESISVRSHKFNAGETIDEERRRKRKEQEEKRRRIEENQRRASMERKLRQEDPEGREDSLSERRREKTESTDSTADKRRSLQDLWETLASPTSTNSSEEAFAADPPVQMVIKTDLRSAPTSAEFQLSSKEEPQNEQQPCTMDEEEVRSSPTAHNGMDDSKHHLSEEEMRWETAGHFQPGKLKSRFHEMAKDAPAPEKPQSRQKSGAASRYDWMKNEAPADQALLVPHKLNVNLEAKQTETADDRKSEEPVDKNQSKPLWEDNAEESSHQNNTGNESDSEEERKPLVEKDEYHKLTEEELRWEGAGQFQPSKLNKSLFVGFNRPSVVEQERPKSTQLTKKEVVSSRVEPTESRPSLVVENEYEEGDRAVVGRVQEIRTPEEEEEDEIVTPEMKLRQIEQERRRTELEEIERAREEERRRREREEQEETRETEELPDDEFDLKVKKGSVNKIDRSLLGQFSQADRKEEDLPRRRKPQQTKPVQGEAITISSTIEVVESQPVESAPYPEESQQVSVTAVKESDLADDEFERKVLGKKIGKINLGSGPFSGEPPAEQAHRVSQRPEPKRKDIGEEARKPFEEVIPVTRTIEVVESLPTDFGPGEDDSSDEVPRNKDFTDDPFERKVQEKKIGKINLVSSPFMGSSKAEEPQPEIRRKRKEEARRDEETRDYGSERSVVEVVESAKEQPIESAPVVIENEDDEFELKVKKKEVKKLNMAQFEFQQREAEEKEQRLRQLEEERRRKERDEAEKLKREEQRRRLQLEAEARARAEEEERIRREEEELELQRREEQREPDYHMGGEEVSEDPEPRSVGKLDITKFSQFQREATPPPKPPRTYEARVAQSPQEPVVQTVAASETHTAPAVYSLENGDEDLDYEEKRKDVGRLNADWYFRQQEQEAEEARRKARNLEEERRRLEREEIERSRQEEVVRQDTDPAVGSSERGSSEKPSNVGKLNLGKFSQFQQSPPVNTQKPARVEVDGGPKAQTKDVVIVSSVAEVEGSPEVEYEVESSDKPGVGKLSYDHVAMFNNKADVQTTPEKRRGGSQAPKRVEVVAKEEPPSPPRDADQENFDERTKNVKKLDVDRFIQSRREESLERQQRKKQLEEERLRLEKLEMEERKLEERRRNDTGGPGGEDVIEVSGGGKLVQINGNTDHDDKPKNVGKLNLGQFSQFQQAGGPKPKATQERKPRQETRGNEPAPRRYVVERKDEAQPYKDINHNVAYKIPTSAAGEGEQSKTVADGGSVVKSNSPDVKVLPKRLSRDLFAAFESGDQPAPMRRAKSEMQLNKNEGTVAGRKAWRDDDAVTESRRRKDSREQKRPRPKSIAFIDTSMFEN